MDGCEQILHRVARLDGVCIVDVDVNVSQEDLEMIRIVAMESIVGSEAS